MPAVRDVKSIMETSEEYHALTDRVNESAAPSELFVLIERVVLVGMRTVEKFRMPGAAKKQLVMDALFELLNPFLDVLETVGETTFAKILPSFVSVWIDTVVAVRNGKMDYKTGFFTIAKSCCS